MPLHPASEFERRRLVVPSTMTSTPQNPAGEPDDVEDQDAEPTMNTTADERPDALETEQDGGSTEDVI